MMCFFTVFSDIYRLTDWLVIISCRSNGVFRDFYLSLNVLVITIVIESGFELN